MTDGSATALKFPSTAKSRVYSKVRAWVSFVMVCSVHAHDHQMTDSLPDSKLKLIWFLQIKADETAMAGQIERMHQDRQWCRCRRRRNPPSPTPTTLPCVDKMECSGWKAAGMCAQGNPVTAGASLRERELREGLWLLRDGMTDSRTYARYRTTFSILTGTIEHSSDAI